MRPSLMKSGKMSVAPSGLGLRDRARLPRAYAAGLCFFRPFGPGVLIASYKESR